MAEIPGFWDVGPHAPLPVEPTWQRFVQLTGGSLVSDLLPSPAPIQNADFLFTGANVVIELKEIETEFLATAATHSGLIKLFERVAQEDPQWRPFQFGGTGQFPRWFYLEYQRFARPPISRVLKKANRQIRETKKYFGIDSPTGILLFVNDGFTGMAPDLVQALASDLLLHSYSSIDCLIYLTVNRYVELVGSDEPALMWSPVYHHRALDALVDFVDALGRKWYDFLETETGVKPRRFESQNRDMFRGSKAIILPDEIR